MPSTDKCEVAVCADTNTCGNLKQLETDQTLKPRANVRNLDGLLMQLCTIERNLNIQPDIEKEAQHRDTQKKIDIKLKTLKKPNERHRTDKDLLDLRRHQTGPHVKEHIHDRRPHRGSAEHPCKTQAFDNDWCDKKDPAVSKNWDVSSQKRCGEGEHPLPALALPNEYGHSNACGQHDKILSGGKEKCLERHLCDITIIASTQASWKDDSNIQQKTQDALAECQENVRQKHDSLTEQESLCGNDNSNDLSGLTESVCRMMAVARMWPSTAGRLSNCKQTNSDGEFDEENLRNSITCINIENEDQSARGKPSSGYYCNHRNAKSSKKRRGYKENNRNTDSRCIGRSENTKTTSAYTPQSQTAVAKDKQGAHNSSVAKNGDNCIEKNFCDHAESRAGQSGSQNPIADSGYLGSFDARVSTAIGEQAINKSKKSTKLRRNAQDSKPFHCQQQDSLQQESTIDVVERQNRDCNLKIPFEKYIVGKVSSTHVEAKRDFRNDRKAGNHHSAKTLANRMRDSSERTSLKKQQAHHKDIAKPKSKTLTKSHRKLSVEQSLTQDAAGAKGNGRQHVLREASCEKNQPEEIKRECRKPLLHLRDCKDVEAEKNNENAGKNSKNRKHWRTSQHHSSKTQKPEADNPCGKRSDYQKAGNLVGSERKTRYCREEIKGGGTHIFSTETWHTRLHESKNMIRPERRNSRSKREKPTCLHSKENGHWNDRYKRSSSLLSTSSSTDSSYSTDSSLSTSSYDTISSSPKSSSGDRRVEKRYTREQYRKPYKDCTASRKPWRDSAQVDASAGNVHGSRRHKSRYKKSASSASSCHRRPAAVEPRHNSRIEKCADGVTSKVDADPHSLSPVEESNDPAFGLLRKKRLTTAAVRAEEDVYSAWQRQHVELVGPKPDLGGAGRLHHQIDNDKDRKAQQYSKPVGGAFLQQSLQRTSSSDASKRPVTINDLYSFHLVLSDTQNGMVRVLKYSIQTNLQQVCGKIFSRSLTFLKSCFNVIHFRPCKSSHRNL